MKVKRLKVAYFSTTGGTEKAAKMLAELFGMPTVMIDLTLPEARKQTITCEGGDMMIVACPVFGGTIPDVEGLFENLHGDGTPCILMATYGNRHYDDALAQLRERMGSQGFLILGAVACIIPHAFSETLGAGRPNGKDKQDLADFVFRMQDKLCGWSIAAPELPGDGTIPPKHIPYMPKTWDADACVHCGLCADKCPAGAIDHDSLAINHDICINCTCCSRVCPMNARTQDYAGSTAKLEANFAQPRPIEVFI